MKKYTPLLLVLYFFLALSILIIPVDLNIVDAEYVRVVERVMRYFGNIVAIVMLSIGVLVLVRMFEKR